MSYDYSENILVQESAGNLLRDELGWDVKFAYKTEVLGDNGSFPSYYQKTSCFLSGGFLCCKTGGRIN